MNSSTFRSFLERSLVLLQGELPAGYAFMAARLGRREVAVDVDGDRLAIIGDGRWLRVVDGVLHPVARARGTSAAISAILQGERTLESAVLEELIHLRGSLADLVAFYESLQAYFNAAVRCPSFAGLLAEYLDSVARSSEVSRS